MSADLSNEWFTADRDRVWQGSLLRNLKEAFVNLDGDGEAVDHPLAIVLTQTCDIPKARRLLLARVDPYSTLISNEGSDHFRSRNFRKALSENTAIAHFLLPPNELADWSVASFRDTFHADRGVSEGALQDGVALTTPYRERLSQAYARFIMRIGLDDVGLPGDEFERYAHGLLKKSVSP